MNEPKISINGIELLESQAMTLRVALQNFILLVTEEGCGEDQLGLELKKNYLARAAEINLIMQKAI